jgi:hypothetical protein
MLKQLNMGKNNNLINRKQKDITPLEMIHLRNRRHTMTNEEIDHFIGNQRDSNSLNKYMMSNGANSHITTDQSLKN